MPLFCPFRGAFLGTLLLSALVLVSPAYSKAGANESGATLSFQDALAQTLMHNSELAVFSEEIRAREAEALQAGLRPNPLLSFEVENFLGSGGFSGINATETTVTLRQAIELGKKRSRRHELAEAETMLAQSDYLLTRTEVLARTADAFITALAAQERMQLVEETTGLAKQVLVHVEERIAAGKAAATESIRARIHWRELEIDRNRARRDLVAAQRALAARMGLEIAGFESVAGNLSRATDLPDPAELERSIGKSPQIARRVAETERRRRAVDLESARRFPDLEVSLGSRYLRESDDTAMVAGISVPLPLFNSNQGANAAARSRLSQAQAEERSASVQVKAALNAAWHEMAAAHAEAAALASDILPAALQALEAVDYGYRAGKFGLLDVLDAQRTLVEAQKRQLEAHAAYFRAANELSRLLGRELPAIWPSALISAFEKD
ncbi:MAG: TolC family protein [Desulfobacteraceae bacterium]|nr:MAG: TolC family protein [Desulfobacteraceae bacterium]